MGGGSVQIEKLSLPINYIWGSSPKPLLDLAARLGKFQFAHQSQTLHPTHALQLPPVDCCRDILFSREISLRRQQPPRP